MRQELIQSFIQSEELIANFHQNSRNIELLEKLAIKIANSFSTKGKVLICGNGGSACDAMHFAEEFTGRFRKDRKPLPVIHLADPGHLTCVANDYGFNEVFARGVEAHGNENDWLISLSTSGNSQNVISAVAAAKKISMQTCNLLGKDGGKLKNSADIEFIIPGKTADRIQEVHMTILHILIEAIERILFPELYATENVTAVSAI